MWKKLKFIQILIANGVPLVSQLFEEYKTALRDFVQGHHDVSCLSLGRSMLMIHRLLKMPTFGLSLSFDIFPMSMITLPFS